MSKYAECVIIGADKSHFECLPFIRFFVDLHPPTRKNINTPREAFRDRTAFPGFRSSPRDGEDK